MTSSWRILHGDVREQLRTLPDGCAQTCVTSPPYWGLRDYGTAPQVWGVDSDCAHEWGPEKKKKSSGGLNSTTIGSGKGQATSVGSLWEGSQGCYCDCGAWRGHLGNEPTPDLYVANLVAVMREVRRVLREDGTVWLNLGDSYAGSGRGGNPDAGTKQGTNRGSQSVGVLYGREQEDKEAERTRIKEQNRLLRSNGVKPKDLVGIPWRVAFALQADGWYLRSDIIWAKPNPMPESVTDRPTKAHEYIFLLSKSARYYYDAAAIREPYSPSTLREFAEGYKGTARKDYAGTGAQNASDVKRRIVDKQRGHGRRHAGFNDRWDAMPKDEQQMGGANKRSVWHVATQPYPEAHFATYPEKLIEPCILAGAPVGGTVVDPFNGSGTTGVVAIRHQRNYIGIDLNADYIAMARRRIGAVAPLFSSEASA